MLADLWIQKQFGALISVASLVMATWAVLEREGEDTLQKILNQGNSFGLDDRLKLGDFDQQGCEIIL